MSVTIICQSKPLFLHPVKNKPEKPLWKGSCNSRLIRFIEKPEELASLRLMRPGSSLKLCPWLMKCWGSRNVGTDYPIMQYTSIFCNVIFPKARFFELFNSVFSRFPPSFLHLVGYWSVIRQDEMCIWAVTYLFTQWWILFKFLPDLLKRNYVLRRV